MYSGWDFSHSPEFDSFRFCQSIKSGKPFTKILTHNKATAGQMTSYIIQSPVLSGSGPNLAYKMYLE